MSACPAMPRCRDTGVLCWLCWAEDGFGVETWGEGARYEAKRVAAKSVRSMISDLRSPMRRQGSFLEGQKEGFGPGLSSAQLQRDLFRTRLTWRLGIYYWTDGSKYEGAPLSLTPDSSHCSVFSVRFGSGAWRDNVIDGAGWRVVVRLT